jgi:hypothetical protein
VIGTHGVGAWILDDIGPLVELAEAMAEDAFLFTVRTATDWESWNRDSNLGQSTFVGENPAEGAYLSYWLADSTAAADLTLARADELRAFLDGPVAELNELLDGRARIEVTWPGPWRRAVS